MIRENIKETYREFVLDGMFEEAQMILGFLREGRIFLHLDAASQRVERALYRTGCRYDYGTGYSVMCFYC